MKKKLYIVYYLQIYIVFALVRTSIFSFRFPSGQQGGTAPADGGTNNPYGQEADDDDLYS